MTIEQKEDKKFQLLKQEFVKTIKYFSDLEEKTQIKADSIIMSFDNHYNNLMKYLLEKVSIKKYIEKINVDSSYNLFKKDKVDIYGVYSAYIKIDKEVLNEKVVNNIVKRILKKLVNKEIEKQFWYILSMYNFYNNVISEYHIRKYYYYYYYKNSILKKYKELNEEELLELLDNLFWNKENFTSYFSTYSHKIRYKIIDLLELSSMYIDFFEEFKTKKYIWRDGKEKEKKQIQLIWIRGNTLNGLWKVHGGILSERERVLKRNYEISIGKKINVEWISVKTFYFKKIKVEQDKDWNKKVNIINFIKSIKKNMWKLLFFDNFNTDFFLTNLYTIGMYQLKKEKKQKIEFENYTDLLNLSSIKSYILEKHNRSSSYIFNIKDFILINDDILTNIIDSYTDINDNNKLKTSLEKYILEYIMKISLNTNNDIDQLVDQLWLNKDWWYNKNYDILLINKQIKKNLLTFLNQFVDITDYKLNINIGINI